MYGSRTRSPPSSSRTMRPPIRRRESHRRLAFARGVAGAAFQRRPRARAARRRTTRAAARTSSHPPTNSSARAGFTSPRRGPAPPDLRGGPRRVHCRDDGEGVASARRCGSRRPTGPSLNVGRSLRLDTTRDDRPRNARTRAHARRRRARARRSPRANLDDYDSAPPRSTARRYGARSAARDWMLRWLGEREFVTSNLTRFRCGRASFSARAGRRAARQQGGVPRSMVAQPALALVLNESRCTQQLGHATKGCTTRPADAECRRPRAPAHRERRSSRSAPRRGGGRRTIARGV